MATKLRKARAYEWPTILLLALVYVFWIALTIDAFGLGLVLNVLLLIPLITLHSSLQHEFIHIIEPKYPHLAQILVFPAIGLFIPYIRFRDAHLAHHENEIITDPYDDPESFYLAKEKWNSHCGLMKSVLALNNTLAGRMILGPIVGQIAFMMADIKLIVRGDRNILLAWLWHIPAVAIVLVWLIQVSSISLLHYAIAAYLGLSILKIRTYLEHRAEESVNGRSVVIEDRGILAFLFLNNNIHAVHHAHPSVPWYNLPALYRNNKAKFLGQNKGYVFKSYAQIFRLYFFKSKEPVVHPFWSHENRNVR